MLRSHHHSACTQNDEWWISDAGELPQKEQITFRTRRKLKNKNDRKFAYRVSVAGLSPWRPGFTPVPVRVGFVLTKWQWDRFFSYFYRKKRVTFTCFSKEVTHITKSFKKQNLCDAFKTRNNVGKVLNTSTGNNLLATYGNLFIPTPMSGL